VKLLMENWRKYLDEENLNEVLYGMDDLPEDFKVEVSPSMFTGGQVVGYEIELFGGRVDRWGQPRPIASGHILSMDRWRSPWCFKNDVFMSGFTRSYIKGWGLFLYDIMIEYATLKGGGLTPHKEGGHLSPDSERVWQTYFNNKKGAIAGDNLEIEPIPPGDEGCSTTGLSDIDDLIKQYEYNNEDCQKECEYEEDERNPDGPGPQDDYSKEYYECTYDCEEEFGEEEAYAAEDKMRAENAEKFVFAHSVYRKAPTVIKALGERFIDNT